MNKSENINELASALAKAQGELKPAKMNKTNPFFKSKYADLESVWDSIRSSFSKHGLSITQAVHTDDKGSCLETTLLHSSGQWFSSSIPLNPDKVTPQALGSAITYARRYALSAIAGVCSDEDDDANAASIEKKDTIKKTEPSKSTDLVTDKQIARLMAIANDFKWDEAKLKDTIKLRYGVTSRKLLTQFNCDHLIGLIQGSARN